MFYERFLQLCQKVKISPSAAATNAGFNRGTVSVWKKKYEAGLDVAPEQDIINKICNYFGCTELWLRGMAPEKEKAPTPEGEREISNPDIRMIARAGKKMTPEQAENLRKYAQYMFPEAFKDDDT